MNFEHPSQHRFKIRSLNCHRRYEVLISLLNNSDPKLIDILCIQEPPPTFARFPSLSPRQWDRLLPFPSDEEFPPKCFIYISKCIPSSSFSQIHVPHSNITALRIQVSDLFISLFNIYNPPNSTETIDSLQAHLCDHRTGPSATDAIMLIGDFNKHDPLWSGPLHPRRTRGEADSLVDIILRHGLELCLEPGTPTFLSPAHRTWSTLDLLFVSEDRLLPALSYCQTFGGDASDHLGLEAEFSVYPELVEAKPRPRFKETDWDAFAKAVPRHFEEHPLPTLSPSPESLDTFVTVLEAGLQHILAEMVPLTKVSQYRNRWWTAELTTLRREYRKVQRRINKADRSHASWKALKQARNKYIGAITKQKRSHWRQYLEQLTQEQLWTAARYTDDCPAASTRVPALQTPGGLVSSTEGKCATLFTTFFPTQLASYQPPEPASTPRRPILCEPFEQDDVRRAIARLAPFKAPGPSGIPNVAIKSAHAFLGPVLLEVLRVSLACGHFPTPWKSYSTVTLRKPGKSDYTVAKAYRPVALEDTLGKVLESVIATRLSALAEAHQLLPATQFGGRPGRTTTDAVLFLTQKVKDAWRTGRVASLLLMDISQAFPTVPHPTLLAKLTDAGLPRTLVDWVRSFLTERTTTLSFDDFTSPPQLVPLGIPQGSPLSPILYLLFNADLLQLPSKPSDPTSGFIDDTAKLVVSNSVAHNIGTLNSFLRQADRWGVTNGSRYDYQKFQLIHFWGRKTRPASMEVDLRFRAHVIQPTACVRYLGVLLDEKLSFKFHAEQALARGTRTLGAVGRLRIPHGYMRQLILAMVFPRIEYALLTWYEPVTEGQYRKGGSVGLTRAMAKLQRRAAKLITGAFNTTATDMADYHAHLLPAHLRLDLSTFKAAVRLCTLPPHHPLHSMVKRCRRPVKRHRSVLHKLMHTFPELRDPIELIRPSQNPDLAIKDAVSVRIAKSRASAKQEAEDAVQRGALCVFSDGSGYKGGVGAAAIAVGGHARIPYRKYVGELGAGTGGEEGVTDKTQAGVDRLSLSYPSLSPSNCISSSFSPLSFSSFSSFITPSVITARDRQDDSPDVRRLHLGPEQDHTVFEAEVCGAILALDLVRATPRATRASLFLDCQPAISALMDPGAQPGQYLLQTFWDELRRLQQQRTTLHIEIHWVPGHEDMHANEQVDIEAKKAATNSGANQVGRLRCFAGDLPRSAAALIATRKVRASTRWKSEWLKSASAKKLRPIALTPPSRKVRAFYRDLSRNECAILTQLRTGHAPLNAHLARIRRTDSPLCSKCKLPETASHFLLTCRKYATQRRALRTALCNRPLTLRTTLGPGARVGPVLSFIKDSGRFPHLFPVPSSTLDTGPST